MGGSLLTCVTCWTHFCQGKKCKIDYIQRAGDWLIPKASYCPNMKGVNVNVVYSGHALSFETASLGMPLEHRKQITLNEHNMVKNPNWLEADQLAIYKA